MKKTNLIVPLSLISVMVTLTAIGIASRRNALFAGANEDALYYHYKYGKYIDKENDCVTVESHFIYTYE